MYTIQPVKIEKEDLTSLTFPETPLKYSSDRRSYLNQIVSKLTIGTTSLLKVIFFDTDGVKEVEAFGLISNDNHVLLSNGGRIPLHRLVDIQVNQLAMPV